MMSVKHRNRRRFLFLPLLVLAATAARADQTITYQVTGPIGAALWGLGDEPGTEVLAFAFTHVTPIKPDTPDAAAQQDALPPPGPRLAFSVTQWVPVDDSWVRRQWYGDAALTDKALVIPTTLAEGKLDVTVMGTLEERSESGVSVRRDVPGRLQVQWLASSNPANTTLAYTYQTPSFATVLQTTGAGRAARATGTLTVEALGDPIEIWGLGSLSAVKTGLLSVAMQ
jgi:hypothetical protein